MRYFLQGHKGDKILALALNVNLLYHRGPLLPLIDPVINLVMDYLICLHVCHNYVNIMIRSIASCGIKIWGFFQFFFFSISSQRKRKAGKSMQQLEMKQTWHTHILQATCQQTRAFKKSKAAFKCKYFTNLIICIYSVGSKHLLGLWEVRDHGHELFQY